MASVREVSSITEDLLCPICLSIFLDPHMLGCGHNFCFSCLESCIASKGQHQGMCPQCRAPFDLQDAARNRVLSNLSEKARLLKLEEGPPSGGAGSHYFCEEHEEPLKLFCSQDEAPICVICRDLPQHQGHGFLPFKNAVKAYQEKLKASQKLLENGAKWATDSQSRQLEVIEELETQSQNLCGSIFIAFEELREILNEREQSMLETVKEMKEDNLAEMNERLEYLKAYGSSHTETISSIRATLEETSEFAFLKGIKELMGRIQDRLNEEGDGADEESQGAREDEEEQSHGEQANENWAGSKGDQVLGGEGEAYGEATWDAEKGEDGDIVPIDPSLEELEESLDFESWKEMVRSIGIGETDAPDSLYGSPPQEEDMLPPEDSSTCEAAKEEVETAVEDLASPVEASPWAPGKGSLDRQSSSSTAALPMRGPLYQPPDPFLGIPRPPFQQVPFYNLAPMRVWRTAYPRRGTPQNPWGCRRATPWRQSSSFRQGQGRRDPRNVQVPQPSESSVSHSDNWKASREESCKPREDQVRQGSFSSNKQRPQASGGHTSGESRWESLKKEPPKPRKAHASGKGRGLFNKQRPQSSEGQSRGESTKKEPFKPREAHAAGQGRGFVKEPLDPPTEGKAAGSWRPQSRPKTSHHRGRGRGQGSGSAKGPQNK